MAAMRALEAEGVDGDAMRLLWRGILWANTRRFVRPDRFGAGGYGTFAAAKWAARCNRAVPVGEGAMAAVLGLGDWTTVEALAEEEAAEGEVCQVANENDPDAER